MDRQRCNNTSGGEKRKERKKKKGKEKRKREPERERERRKGKKEKKRTWKYIIIRDGSAHWEGKKEGGEGEKRPPGYDNVSLLPSAVRE